MEIILWPARVNPWWWRHVRALGGGRGVVDPVASHREQESIEGTGLYVISGAKGIG